MIGNKLKELRTQKGYTIVQLCKELEMNQNTYAKYERNERDVSTDTLSQLADFYEVSTDYLLGRTTVKQMATEKTDPVDVNSPEFTKRIIAKYEKLNENMRALCMEMFRQISGVIITENGEVKQEPQITPQPVQQTVVQPSDQATPAEQQPQIEVAQSQWRFAARRTDGVYENRPATPEEVEKLKLLENAPEPKY